MCFCPEQSKEYSFFLVSLIHTWTLVKESAGAIKLVKCHYHSVEFSNYI